MYGDSEELIGKWFKKTGKRSEIFLATKFAITGDETRPVNGDPEYVKECMAKSLSRLGGMPFHVLPLCYGTYSLAVDYVDLYYMHRYVPLSIVCRCYTLTFPKT